MTSHRGEQAIASAGRGRELMLRCRFAVTVAALTIGVGTAQLATAFLQVPDEPSPASGTAQVVAQGVADIQDGDIRWEITERSAPPPANAAESTSDLGFLIVAVVSCSPRTSLPGSSIACHRAKRWSHWAAPSSCERHWAPIRLIIEVSPRRCRRRVPHRWQCAFQQRAISGSRCPA